MDSIKSVKRLFRGSRCELSLIVVYFDMAREIQRTLYSLTRTYQRGVDDLNYEVIVVDNGSPVPLPEAQVARCGSNFSLLRIDGAGAAPAAAINRAVSASRGRSVGVMIDGARMLSPGVLRGSWRALRQSPDAVVATLGFHLGPEHQRFSSLRGYDQRVEDRLLAGIDWKQNGYRLFEIACLADSARYGWFGPIAECNCIALSRARYEALGGYDTAFRAPGGGLSNHDFYRRACEYEDAQLFYLLGEGCFHQIHGGVTTGGRASPVATFDQLHEEYRSLRGGAYQLPDNEPTLLGRMPRQARWLNELANRNRVSGEDLPAKMNHHLEQAGLDDPLAR